MSANSTENSELLNELMNVSGSGYKVARTIVRELENQKAFEVQMSIPEIARRSHLSENTVRARIKELKYKVIHQREDRGKLYFSLQEQYHDKLEWVQKLNPAKIAGVQKLNPAKIEPLPKKIPDRLFRHYRKFAKADEKLKRETARKICAIFSDGGSNRFAYKRLLQALRGYAAGRKKMTFDEMFKSNHSVEIGVIKYYEWRTRGK